ncbi:MAG: TrkH family potassium uptake protein [archaeon]|nr:TrkH family potassium uptake protein [archaeon]
MLVRLGSEDIRVVMRDVGSLIKWSSTLFAIPFLAGLWFHEAVFVLLVYALVSAFSFVLGLSLKRAFDTNAETDLKHAFMIVAIIWLVFTAISAIPFSLIMGMGFVDSFFETMSAITTTGISIMAPFIDSAPKSLILWRSFISWMGGIGIIVLGMMGIFTTYTKSAKLMVAEGRESTVRPNFRNTAKEIWIIYIFLTAFCVGLLLLAGLDLFQAINYGMSAISTTGMDSSSAGLIGANVWVVLAMVATMLIGATSFSLHYLFLRKRDYMAYLRDNEFKAMISVLVISVLLVLPKMIAFYPIASNALQVALFHNTSALTGGGFYTVSIGEFSRWGDFSIMVLLGLMVIGASSNSTGGGIKVSRAMIFVKSIYWRIKELILPKDSFFQKKFDGKLIENRQVREVNQFILLYLVLIAAGVFVLTLEGAGFEESLFSVVSAQGNVGLQEQLVDITMPLASKIMLIFNMWVGRLEIIPLLSAIGFALSFKKT